MGLSHNLGRRIGASYDVPHGITSCIILPHVMRAFAPIYPHQLARIAQALGLPYQDDTSGVLAAADAVSKLIEGLGLPQHLNDVGVNETELATIANSTPSRELSAEQVEQLLQTML
jgi:alcohol dehydrogenase class IV